MTYVRTPLNAPRVPKYIDQAFVDATALTLRVASPRQMNLPYEQQAVRMLTALHEGAHFVAMAEVGDPVISVVVAPNPITRRKGNCGMVCGAKSGGYENEWLTTLVGAHAEYMLLNPYPRHLNSTVVSLLPLQLSAAHWHDCEQAEKACRNWYEGEVGQGRLDGPAEKHIADALADGRGLVAYLETYILQRWQLIELCATVFLIYGDSKGKVGTEVIGELEDVVTERMKTPWPKQHRSSSAAALLNSLPPDVLGIWRKHSPHIDPEDWPDAA